MKRSSTEILGYKQAGRKVAALTCYDYPMARLLDECDVDILLVGDSLGMVVLGFPDTTHVTMDHMRHHVEAVARARPRALIVADLPYGSFATPLLAAQNARALMASGADAVKLEGGLSQSAQIAAIRESGIPLMGHLGMLPQSIREEGAYRKKGRTPQEHDRLMTDAQFLDRAGAFATVLELVIPGVASEISKSVSHPTIGIGSGPDCDGQVLVTPDLIGSFPWFTPKFVQPRASVAGEIRRAVGEWKTGLH
ncbi:MAG: 3-methyl-2-oxobutanoate hydroxymethyltransferase [Verrucomicrobiae bacterium]|nr:3-methyl-2-oxobutanoate hydroxymethyltransferase [Verrucomicrobiae bacterium]